MSARHPLSAPDMGGLKDDWDRYRSLRHEAEEGHDQAEETIGDATEPRTHDATPEEPPKRRTGRSRRGRRPAPAAAEAVPTTVRFAPEEAGEVDRFILDLRDEAGRKRLDKAEVVREVLRLAREHDPTRRALLKRLRN